MTYTSHDGKTFAFNDHVCAEMVSGPIERRTGRLVQVRKGVGAFGSDIYFLRLRDGALKTFENVLLRKTDDRQFEHAFYIQNDREPPIITNQDIDPADSIEASYTISGEWPAKGFIIDKPNQPPSPVQSFAMQIRG